MWARRGKMWKNRDRYSSGTRFFKSKDRKVIPNIRRNGYITCYVVLHTMYAAYISPFYSIRNLWICEVVWCNIKKNMEVNKLINAFHVAGECKRQVKKCLHIIFITLNRQTCLPWRLYVKLLVTFHSFRVWLGILKTDDARVKTGKKYTCK